MERHTTTMRFLYIKAAVAMDNKTIKFSCLTFLQIHNLRVDTAKMIYSEQEKLDIVSVFIKTNQNQRLARREYRRLYPSRRFPSEKTFVNLYKRLRNSGSIKRKPRTVRGNENQELNILLYFQGNKFI